jgi:hypothetical protein
MSDGRRILTIPRHNPVNAFTMGGIVQDAGLTVEQFRTLLYSHLSAVMAIPVERNREIAASGDLDRSDTRGHECHMFRLEEFRAFLAAAGLADIEIHANGWLIPDDDAEIGKVGSEEWQFLFDGEVEASKESPAAGEHMIAWGRAPESPVGSA